MLTKQRQALRKNKKPPSQNQARKKPGSTGKGDYYHIEVQPKGDFVTFRTQDVGRRGHIQRVAGQRSSGYWTTVKWLIGKEDAHVQGNKLVPDTKDAKSVIEELGSQPIRVLGDRFKARPTPAQLQARRENIKKAQAAQRKK